MIKVEIEAIYWLAQIIFLGRTFYHASVSKKANRSITPMAYWIMALVGNLLIGLYGFFIGSFSMPLFSLISLPISLYHINIEKKRLKK